MDGRIATLLLGFALPLILLGVDIAYFATNPLVVLILFAVIIGASIYLLTYSDSFGAPEASVSES